MVVIKEKVSIGGIIYRIDNIWQYGNLLKITFDENVDIDNLTSDMSKFDLITLLTRGRIECGYFENFDTIYKIDGQELTLSNNGSVYKEPVIQEPTPVPEYIPTLEEVQKDKINELSGICEQLIENGVYVEIDGEMQHFTYKKDEDQNKIKEAFDTARETGLSVPWHCHDGSCRLYSPEEIATLYAMQQKNYVHNQTYYNQMRLYILSLDDKDVIKAIHYGDELSGVYLETYNQMMEQSTIIIEAMLKKGSDETTSDQPVDENQNTTDGSETGIATENTENKETPLDTTQDMVIDNLTNESNGNDASGTTETNAEGTPSSNDSLIDETGLT